MFEKRGPGVFPNLEFSNATTVGATLFPHYYSWRSATSGFTRVARRAGI